MIAKLSRLLCSLALGLTVATAQAAVVYDNGGPNGVSGNETTNWIQAEDFSIAGGGAITDATIYLGGFGGIGNWDGTLQYYFFADAGGAPGAAALATGNALDMAVTDTGIPFVVGGNVFAIHFNTQPFVANAGTTYWFGIHASANFDRDDIYWVTTDPTTGNGQESSLGTLDNWSNNGQEHAFQLSSEQVPEPGSLALLGLGLTCLMAGRRRQV